MVEKDKEIKRVTKEVETERCKENGKKERQRE